MPYLTSTSGCLLSLALIVGLGACAPTAGVPETDSLNTAPASTSAPTDSTTPAGAVTGPAPLTASDERVVARVEVGGPPGILAAGDGVLWATAGNSIVKIDPKTNQLIGKPITPDLPASTGIEALAFAEGSLWIGVVAWGDLAAPSDVDSVWRIDPDTGETIAAVKVGRGPMNLASTPGAIWVPEFGRGEAVAMIDAATNQLAREPVVTGEAPLSLAAGAGSVWVANHDAGTLTRIDEVTREAVAEIALPAAPHRVAFGEGAVWVGLWHEQAVLRIDPQTNEAVGEPIPIGYIAGNIAAGLGSVWVTSDYRGEGSDAENVVLVRIDPQSNQAVEVIALGGRPMDVELTEDAVWVSIHSPNMVLRIRP